MPKQLSASSAMYALFCLLAMLCFISTTQAALKSVFTPKYPTTSLHDLPTTPYANDHLIYLIEFAPQTAYLWIRQFQPNLVGLVSARSALVFATGISLIGQINTFKDVDVADITFLSPLPPEMKGNEHFDTFFEHQYQSYPFQTSPPSDTSFTTDPVSAVKTPQKWRELPHFDRTNQNHLEQFMSTAALPFSTFLDDYTSAATHRFTGMAITPRKAHVPEVDGTISSQFAEISTKLQQTHEDDIAAFELFATGEHHQQCQQLMRLNKIDSKLHSLFTSYSQFFTTNNISAKTFFKARQEVNNVLFSKPNLNPIRSTSFSSLQSSIPLHHAFSHSTMQENTMKESTLPLSYFTFHIQSPLFLTSPSQFTTMIQSRVESIYNALITSSCGNQEPCANSLENTHTFHKLLRDITISTQSPSTLPTQTQFSTFLQQFLLFYGDLDTKMTALQKSKHASNVKLFSATPLFSSISNESPLQHQLFRHIDSTVLSFIQTALETQSNPQSTSLSLSPPSLFALTQTYLQQQLNHVHQTSQNLLSTLAKTPTVFQLEVELPQALQNFDSRLVTTIGTDQIPVGYTKHPQMTKYGPYAEMGINGKDVILSVSDSGMDSGSCFFSDPDHKFPYTGVVGKETVSEHRKVKSYFVFGDEKDNSGHGSHVVGSVLGKCIDPDFAPSVDFVNGQSFEGRVAFQDISGSQGFKTPDHYSVLWSHALNNGAHISSNSWGCVSQLGATNACASPTSRGFQTDKFLHENQSLLILIAASNYGTDAFETVGAIGIAKNVLSVGAAYATRTAAARSDPEASKLPAFSAIPTSYDPLHVVAGYSNKGPAIDQRIKPDIIAPGSSIFSVMNQLGNRDGKIIAQDGTSMATPTLAGSLGLLQQMLQEGRINSGHPEEFQRFTSQNITGTLLKALALNAAQPMDYVQNEGAIANAAPMKNQAEKLDPILQDGNTYNHYRLGDAVEGAFTALNVASYFYIKASQVDTAKIEADPNTRAVSMMFHFSCQGVIDVVASRLIDGKLTPIATTYFYTQGGETEERVVLQFQIPVKEAIFLSFTPVEEESIIEETNCEVGDKFIWVAQEYTHSTVIGSNHFQDISCTDTLGNFSTVFTSNKNWFSQYFRTFRCPPVSECAPLVDAKVQGNRFYHPGSSICRAAIHNNSFNMTKTGIPDVDNRKQTILTVFAGPRDKAIPSTTRNGVTASAQSVDLTLNLMMPQVAGQVVTLPDGRKQNLMNLLPIPHGPNGISGYGLFQLSSILPLTDYSITPSVTTKPTVERQLAILSSGQPYNLVNHGESHSYCFMISPLQLRKSYMYSYLNDDKSSYIDSSTWNSGPDTVRATLAWYDTPNVSLEDITQRHLINNLNLHLFTPDGSEYRGNARADSRNTNERVELLPGTFKPGMYCAVVHGANVALPSYGQNYSLVANGRGLRQCSKTPFPWHHGEKNTFTRETVSGQWIADGKGSCSNSAVEDVSKTLFHSFHNLMTVRQGGTCFTMFPQASQTVTPWSKSDPASFRGMRLSDYQYEREKEWDQDEIHGVAEIKTGNNWVLSGYISHNATLSGFYFEQTGQQSYQSDTYDISGVQTGDNLKLTVSSPTTGQSCSYNYIRKAALSEVQYSHTDVETTPYIKNSSLPLNSIRALFATLLLCFVYF